MTKLFNFCVLQNKVPLLSLEALHHLHIFIFVLAIVHVTFCVLTVLFGGAKVTTPHPFPYAAFVFYSNTSSFAHAHVKFISTRLDTSMETLGGFHCKRQL